ncbi:MAG TPA: hypothetical protein VIU12_27550 [Chryseolinea sp.]
MKKKTLISKRPKGATGRGPATDKPAVGDSQIKVWQSYHVITEHWRSDLQFEKDELNFFRKLISEHFVQFMDKDHAERSRKLTAILTKLDKHRDELQTRIAEHGAQMLKIVKDPLLFVDALLYKHDQEQLENEMLTFIKSHRSLKKKLMLLSEEILRSEKIKHLLAGT